MTKKHINNEGDLQRSPSVALEGSFAQLFLHKVLQFLDKNGKIKVEKYD